MKKQLFLSIALICMIIGFSATAQPAKKQTAAAADQKIEAYYFHNTARCVTCKAVEAEAKAGLESLYGAQVTFKSLDLEEEANKPLARKLEVSGQTLLIVKGDKKVNLTNEGFMYARTNPKKLKAIIKQKVDAL